VSKLARGHVWKAEDALRALAEIAPLLSKVGAEVAWHGPYGWRRASTELVFGVWPRSADDPGVAREDVGDALAMLGWHRLPGPDSGTERLYADSAGRRLRISHLMRRGPVAT
jgi:hypothetical protein